MENFRQVRGRFKLHTLKTEPEHFFKASQGRKTFEVRKNDRDFMEGDYLLLELYNKEKEELTGAEWILVKVGHVLKDFPAIDADYVCMSIAVVDQHVIPF